MKNDLKTLAAAVRKVWDPPGSARAWGLADVAIVRLLKAIEDGPDRNALLEEVAKEIEAAFLRDQDIAAIDVVRGLKR